MIKLLDGVVEYEKLPPEPRTDRVSKAVDAGLSQFEQHRTALIAILQDAHKQGPKTEAFDEPRSWFRLTSLAGTCHWKAAVTDQLMSNADRKARLRVLAKAMEKACALIDGAMRDDIGNELFSAWCEEADVPMASPVRNTDGTLSMVRSAEEKFNAEMRSMAALRTAAVRASREAQAERVGAGRPTGNSVLPHGCVLVLADIYLESTNTRDQSGDGPFGRLVLEFLAALGRELSERRVLKIIEEAFEPVS